MEKTPALAAAPLSDTDARRLFFDSEPRALAGYSTAGVYVVGDRDSINAVSQWHQAHGEAEFLRRRISELTASRGNDGAKITRWQFKASAMLAALQAAETFLAGFEDDATQPEAQVLLATVRGAIAIAEGK